MNDGLMQLYKYAPYPLKVLAASAWGYYLRRWRYGPETDRLVHEALERETWSGEKWQAWQEERLAVVLHRAATRVPIIGNNGPDADSGGTGRPGNTWRTGRSWKKSH